MTWLFLAFVLQAAPAQPAAVPPAPPPADAPPAEPSLDDALGIEPESRTAPPAEDGSGLERSLKGAKPRDILASAIDDMRRSATLLDSKDSGLPTQRAQESVVRKLDELIATAQRMQQQQQQQQQQGGQPGQQQQRKKQQGGKQDERQGQQEPREQGQERGGRPSQQGGAEGRDRRPDGDANAQEPPDAVDPSGNGMQFDESRAEWGRLPPRVRDAVRQGLRDPMSAAYRRLTQEYYKRLAEEPKR
jgi:hypothetical protein